MGGGKKGNPINRYLQHIVQKYLQFINVSASMKNSFWASADSCSFCECQVFVAGFYAVMETTSNLPPPPTLKFSQARNILTHWVWQPGAWLPPIQQPECCLLCLKKTPSGALKSRRTPGTLSPREGCEGCGEGERDSQSGCGMCQKTGHVPVDGHTHKHTTLGFFSAEDCSRRRVCHSADSWDVKRRLQRPEKNR